MENYKIDLKELETFKEFSSDCSDHCANFALTNDKEKTTEIICQHIHKRNCVECNTLDLVLEKMFHMF